MAKETKRILLSLPIDVVAWLHDRAEYNQGSYSSEAVRSIRERMEREHTKSQAATATE